MMCGYQIVLTRGSETTYVPCGQCMPCRINKKRMWIGRSLLENRFSKRAGSFVTLTYSEDNLPNRGSLEPADLYGFLNRLRGRKSIKSLGNPRFLAAAEYGDKTWRPHYHLLLFGIPPEYEQIIHEAWGLGMTKTGDITPESAAYTCGYVTKKMTSAEDPRIEDMGLIPEFSRMSRYPPIGAAGVQIILDTYHTRTGSQALSREQDVPTSFRLGGREYPLGAYWRAWLRRELGVVNPPKYAPWEIDLDQFNEDQIDAEKKAVKLWKGSKSPQRYI